ENEQVVVSLNHQRRLADAEHSFDGLDQRRLAVVRSLGVSQAFAQDFGEHLAGGVLPKSNRSEKGFDLLKPVIGGGFLQFGVFDFLEAASEGARFLFEEAAAHFGGLLTFVNIDPMPNLAFGTGGLDKAEPVTTGAVALLREDLDDIAARNFVT